MAKKLTGGCACGSILPAPRLSNVRPLFHRDDCQRLMGSAFVLNAIIETQTINLLLGKPVAVLASREIDGSEPESPRFWWVGEHNQARLDYGLPRWRSAATPKPGDASWQAWNRG
jgi:hypothetical protein